MIMDLLDIENANILVIDDEKINLELIEKLLKKNGFSNINLFPEAVEALEYYQKTPPDLVLLDINMSGLSGFDVLQRFEDIHHTPQPPVLAITVLTDRKMRLQALKLGIRDFINKPFDDEETIMRMRNSLKMHLAHKENIEYSQTLEELVQYRTKDLLETQNEMIERLALAAEYRDNDTATHTVRVGYYAKVLAQTLGISEQEAENLRLSAPMHDIGKLGIPDNVLLKTGKLNADEWACMQGHAEIGYKILKDSNSLILKNAGIIALSHHEKWDGSGYPSGLKGTEIHLYGRITAVADVFDALTMIRPYKKAWTIEDATQLIRDESGKHFDPSIVEAFNQVLDQLVAIRETFSD